MERLGIVARVRTAYKNAVALWVYLFLAFTIRVLMFAVAGIVPMCVLVIFLVIYPLWTITAMLAYFPIMLAVSCILGVPITIPLVLGWMPSHQVVGKAVTHPVVTTTVVTTLDLRGRGAGSPQ
jgi:hypothetical protein